MSLVTCYFFNASSMLKICFFIVFLSGLSSLLLIVLFSFYYVVASKTKTKLSNSSSEQFITLKPDIGPPVVYKLVTRRPLAGPYAFSNIPIPVWNHPRIFLNYDVSDTWLFSNYSVGYGLYMIRSKSSTGLYLR